MKIEIKDTGDKFTKFTSATAKISIDNLSNTFSFTSGVGRKPNLDFGLGSECVVYIENQRVLTGHIELINGRGSADNSSITIVGRDKTGDIVDSAIGSMDDIQAPTTLKTVLELIIAHIDADIDVVDLVKAKFDTQQDIPAPEIGDNVFDYMEKLARSRKSILSSNDEGNIVIQRNIGTSIKAHIINETNGQSNNVLDYSFDYDHTGRFNKYLSIGNSNLGLIEAILSSAMSKDIVDKKGIFSDDKIREGRQFVIASENPGATPQQEERVKWEANIRKARSKIYTAKVSGFKNQTGDIWIPNTIVSVIDENADINDRMLISSVTFRLDAVEGKTTEISLCNKNAYKLESEEPVEAEGKSIGLIEQALVAGAKKAKELLGLDE
jgi:prophage tail gpP-like protein